MPHASALPRLRRPRLAATALSLLVSACGGGAGEASGPETASSADARPSHHLIGEIVGPLASIDPGASTVVVMGQTIRIDATTAFGTEVEGFDELAVGQKLEVRATYDVGAGTYRATRVDGGHGTDRLRLQLPASGAGSGWAGRG